MDQVYIIRHKVLVEHHSIRSVARETGISRNTVTKYLEMAAPARKEPASRKRPVTSLIGPHIDEILSHWNGRLTPKQRLTGTRIHRQLVEMAIRPASPSSGTISARNAADRWKCLSRWSTGRVTKDRSISSR